MRMCQLCKKRPADSREHVPSKSATNRGPMSVRHVDLAGTPGTGVRHQNSALSDGFTVPSLCTRCNNMTGWRYGGDYADFVRQVRDGGHVEAEDGRRLVYLRGI